MGIQAVKQHTTRHYPRSLPESTVNKIEAAIEAHLDAIHALTTVLDNATPDADLEPYLAEADDEREEDVGDEGEAGSDDDLSDDDPQNDRPYPGAI